MACCRIIQSRFFLMGWASGKLPTFLFCIILFYCIHNKKFAKIISDCRAQFSSILKNLCLALNMNQICKDIQGQTFKAQSRPMYMYVSIETLHCIVHKQVLELAHPKWTKPNFCTQTRLCVHFLYFPPYSVKKKKSRIEGFSKYQQICILYKVQGTLCDWCPNWTSRKHNV